MHRSRGDMFLGLCSEGASAAVPMADLFMGLWVCPMAVTILESVSFGVRCFIRVCLVYLLLDSLFASVGSTYTTPAARSSDGNRWKIERCIRPKRSIHAAAMQEKTCAYVIWATRMG